MPQPTRSAGKPAPVKDVHNRGRQPVHVPDHGVIAPADEPVDVPASDDLQFLLDTGVLHAGTKPDPEEEA